MLKIGAALLLVAWAGSVRAQRPELAIDEKGTGKVGFFRADGTLIKEVPVSLHPHEMSFSADGRYLFTTDNGVMLMTENAQGTNTISMVDVREMRKVATIDLGKYRRPHGIDFDSATGHVLVTTELPSALLAIDPEKRAVIDQYDVKGGAPHMVRIAPDHRTAWITCTDTNSVSVLDLQSRQVQVIPVGKRPQGIEFAPDHKRIYVANSDDEIVTVIDTASRKVVGNIRMGPAHSGPVRVVVSPDNSTAIAALWRGNAISFADTRTLKEEKVIPIDGPPVSMTLSRDGREAYCSIQEMDMVLVISLSERRIVRSFKTPPGSGPDPVLFVR